MEAGDHEGAKVLYEEALRTTGGDGDLKAGFAARWAYTRWLKRTTKELLIRFIRDMTG